MTLEEEMRVLAAIDWLHDDHTNFQDMLMCPELRIARNELAHTIDNIHEQAHRASTPRTPLWAAAMYAFTLGLAIGQQRGTV